MDPHTNEWPYTITPSSSPISSGSTTYDGYTTIGVSTIYGGYTTIGAPLPLAELMLGVVIASFGAVIP
jgi:hypothetical protein